MKKVLLSLAVSLIFSSLVGCSNATTSDVQTSVKEADMIFISLEAPLAGTDFPTEIPTPESLQSKLILVINETNRIVVDDDSELLNPEAGIDFPTEIPLPSSLIGVKILVLKNNIRLPIRIEAAKAGIDFPTDAPATLTRDFLVWNLGQNQRVRLSAIESIEKALAGIDFPTESPASLDRDFYVYTSLNKDFSLARTTIRATR